MLPGPPLPDLPGASEANVSSAKPRASLHRGPGPAGWEDPMLPPPRHEAPCRSLPWSGSSGP
eukprot:4707513-Pleurochrysis_carterae.AAC.1